MSTFIQHIKQFALGALCFAIALALLFPSAIFALEVDEFPTTVSFTITKYVSGDSYPKGEHPAIPEFTFHLDGPIDTSMNSGETIELPAGVYTLTETGPVGYALDFWGGHCDEQTGTSDSEDAVLVITEEDVTENQSHDCTVENVYLGGDGNPTTGVLVVNKTVVGAQTSPNAFSFAVNGGATTTFEADGSNSLILAAGAYSVAETIAPGYTTTYNGCSGTIVAGATSTCAITNTLITGGDGDGDGDATLYKVEGYVWHDANSNDTWEKDNVETEEVETGEADLEGWTVNIVNGSTSFSTVTDASGYYSFMVPAGTWTITEAVQNEWSQTFPNSGSHIVTVPAVVTKAHVSSIFAWFISVAHAQAPSVFGPYDFGNVFTGCTSNCGGGGGGGGSSGGGGGGKKSSSSGSSSDATPVGEVLGAVAPIGAPNTGMGGASGSTNGFASTFMLMALLTFSAFISRRETI